MTVQAGGVLVRTVTTAVDIAAPPGVVWAVLTDLPGYPDWNPVFPQATGEVAAGNTITLRYVQQPAA
jgi:uncharacterized protein YndB with AHSA1/START domain